MDGQGKLVEGRSCLGGRLYAGRLAVHILRCALGVTSSHHNAPPPPGPLTLECFAGMFNAMAVQPLVAAERLVFYRGGLAQGVGWRGAPARRIASRCGGGTVGRPVRRMPRAQATPTLWADAPRCPALCSPYVQSVPPCSTPRVPTPLRWG